MPDSINLIDDLGNTFAVPAEQATSLLARGGYRVESADDAAGRLANQARSETYGGVGGGVVAGGAALLRGATGGGSDALLSALGGAEDLRALQEEHSGLSTGLEIVGGLAPVGVGGVAARAGERAAGLVRGGGAVADIARAGVSAGTEGLIQGAGQGVSELALSDDPLTLERAISVIGTNGLMGAGVGGAVGGATKGLERGLRRAKAALDDVGKRTFKADKALDNILDDPRALAENPKAALSNLRKQEAALDDLVNKHAPKLRESFAADASGTRAAALDFASTALEKNRALQAKIAEVSGKPVSARLDAIADATDALQSGGPKQSIAQQMLSGSVFGHVAGAVSGIPVVGPMIGAKAAGLVSDLVGGKLGSATTAAAERGSKAVQALLDVTRKVSPAAPVLATKVLGSVRYAASQDEKPQRAKGAKPAKAPDLAASYRARSEELRSHIETAPDGKPQVRLATRRKIAAQLAPIAAADPVAADRLETIAVRRLEFLASKIPRRPDLAGMQTGPDRWQPSDMEMRAFARYVAAVEDPTGVVERLADGSITPEDAETMRTVYPEMYGDIQRQIVEQLGELRAQLPYQRRLALSIFSGVPVDPSLDPRVLAVLQGTFASEPGTEGGTMAPTAQPAFGSVSKPSPTPAQERAG